MNPRPHLAAFGLAILATLAALPTLAADTFTPAPLQLLAERVDDHDARIDDITARLEKLEQGQAVRIIVDPIRSYARQSVDATSEIGFQPVKSAPTTTTATKTTRGPIRTVSRSITTTAATPRLKTPAELIREINANYTSTVFATMSPKTSSWAKTHLTMTKRQAPDHVFTYHPSQLVGLSWNHLWNLHNLNHSAKHAINPYVAAPTIAQPADYFDPTPVDPKPNPKPTPPSSNGCPNGRCPTTRGAVQTSTLWYPGKNVLRSFLR